MIRIVRVDSEYIKALQAVDEYVYDNKSCSRPYIGFLIDVDNSLFVAPLTSPKPKHKTWSHKKKDIYLIELKENKPNHYLVSNCCDFTKLKNVCETWK